MQALVTRFNNMLKSRQAVPDISVPMGRLTSVSDYKKTRVVAILDPVAQMLLGPIHDHLFSLLRGLGDIDGTFNHRAACEKLRQYKQL